MRQPQKILLPRNPPRPAPPMPPRKPWLPCFFPNLWPAGRRQSQDSRVPPNVFIKATPVAGDYELCWTSYEGAAQAVVGTLQAAIQSPRTFMLKQQDSGTVHMQATTPVSRQQGLTQPGTQQTAASRAQEAPLLSLLLVHAPRYIPCGNGASQYRVGQVRQPHSYAQGDVSGQALIIEALPGVTGVRAGSEKHFLHPPSYPSGAGCAPCGSSSGW